MAMGTQPQRGTAANHYDLLARLAGGGMAEIFLARANGLEGFERYVVLKRIRSERTDDAMFVGMFLDEARLVAQLQHPNIAQVFDLGEEACTKHGVEALLDPPVQCGTVERHQRDDFGAQCRRLATRKK